MPSGMPIRTKHRHAAARTARGVIFAVGTGPGVVETSIIVAIIGAVILSIIAVWIPEIASRLATIPAVLIIVPVISVLVISVAIPAALTITVAIIGAATIVDVSILLVSVAIPAVGVLVAVFVAITVFAIILIGAVIAIIRTGAASVSAVEAFAVAVAGEAFVLPIITGAFAVAFFAVFGRGAITVAVAVISVPVTVAIIVVLSRAVGRGGGAGAEASVAALDSVAAPNAFFSAFNAGLVIFVELVGVVVIDEIGAGASRFLRRFGGGVGVVRFFCATAPREFGVRVEVEGGGVVDSGGDFVPSVHFVKEFVDRFAGAGARRGVVVAVHRW